MDRNLGEGWPEYGAGVTRIEIIRCVWKRGEAGARALQEESNRAVIPGRVARPLRAGKRPKRAETWGRWAPWYAVAGFLCFLASLGVWLGWIG